MRYAVITPARDEAEHLPRLAASLAAQSQLPSAWVIVDNGSSDGTDRLALLFAGDWPWVRVAASDGAAGAVRGGPVVRAFSAGLDALGDLPELVVKLDADTSFGPEYFAELVARFSSDDRLGIASGTCFERDREGVWREQPMAAGSVWGATRVYRRECLEDVQPLDAEMGWDGIDVLKAELHGWRSQTFREIAFRHHRAEGERDGRRRLAWAARGRASYYMGYRLSFLVLRALYHARRERQALAMVSGYLGAALRRAPQHPDLHVRTHLREAQRLRRVFVRLVS